MRRPEPGPTTPSCTAEARSGSARTAANSGATGQARITPLILRQPVPRTLSGAGRSYWSSLKHSVARVRAATMMVSSASTTVSAVVVHLYAIGRGDGVRAFALHSGKIITGLQREMALKEQVDRGGWTSTAMSSARASRSPFRVPPPACGPHLPTPRRPGRPRPGGLRHHVRLRPGDPHGGRRRPRSRHRSRRGCPALVDAPCRHRRHADDPMNLCSASALLPAVAAGVAHRPRADHGRVGQRSPAFRRLKRRDPGVRWFGTQVRMVRRSGHWRRLAGDV